MRMLLLMLLSVATLAGIVWKVSNDARLNRPARESPQVRTFELDTPPPTKVEARAPKPVEPAPPKRTVKAPVVEQAIETTPAVLPKSNERMLALPLVRVDSEPSDEETLEEEVTVVAAGEFELEPSQPSEPIDQDAWESLIRRMLALYRSNR